jgi:GTPase SAR1 family protein
MNTQRIGVPNLQKHYKKLPETNEELSLPKNYVSSLNSDQNLLFNIIMKTLFEYKNQDPCFRPLRLIIAGTAGYGKTYLIKYLVRTIKIT